MENLVPTHCPTCKSVLDWSDTETDLYCINDDCVLFIIDFASSNAQYNIYVKYTNGNKLLNPLINDPTRNTPIWLKSKLVSNPFAINNGNNAYITSNKLSIINIAVANRGP